MKGSITAAALLLVGLCACEIKIQVPDRVHITLDTPGIEVSQLKCFEWVRENFKAPVVMQYAMLCNPGYKGD